MIDTDIQLDEKIERKVSIPPRYKVVFLNDDSTPIDFVIEILETVYRHSTETAKQLTLTIHTEGAGVAGIYTYEIAEQKASETVTLARASGFPLRITLEEE